MLLKLADTIKNAFKGFESKEIYQQMQKHYQLFQLMDEQGQWIHPDLRNIAGDLIDENLSEQHLAGFIDEMVIAAQKNPYLLSFFEDIKGVRSTQMAEKVAVKGVQVFRDATTFSIVLNRLTIAMYNNPNIIKTIQDIFKAERKKSNNFKYADLFHKVKLISVEMAITNTYAKPIEERVGDPEVSKWRLTINIFEAFATDYLKGRKSNARASKPLMKNQAGGKVYDPVVGRGPHKWSDDRKALRFFIPLITQWTDLYQTWDMAFVFANYPDYPYIIAKLFIPQVAAYHHDPAEYMYKRVLALYLTAYYVGFSNSAKVKSGGAAIDWRDKNIAKIWGETNLESSIKYKQELLRVKQLSKAG